MIHQSLKTVEKPKILRNRAIQRYLILNVFDEQCFQPKLRYFIGATSGIVSLGLLIKEESQDPQTRTLLAGGKVPIIIQFGHFHATDRRHQAQEQKLAGYVNPELLDIREIVEVYEFLWMNPAPNYEFTNEPAEFGDENTTLRGQGIATDYAEKWD